MQDFALRFLLYDSIIIARGESALINQFLRSGTSIGANIREAFYAHGPADFVAKLQIALKECSESEYWIELLLEMRSDHVNINMSHYSLQRRISC